jgi:PleD family two-component response regulator
LISVDPTANSDEQGGPAPADAPVRAIVADDDPFARKMIKEALQRAGVIVIAESSSRGTTGPTSC